MRSIFLIITACLSVNVCAYCDYDGGDHCQSGSGNCTDSVKLVLAGGTGASEILTYGRYCGQPNYCRPETSPNASNPGECNASDGEGVCPPAACDSLDAACKVQDECIRERFRAINYTAATANQADSASSICECTKQRCYCDVEFVASAFQLGQKGPLNDRLCDAAFYEEVFPVLNSTVIGFLGSEAFLFTINSCCIPLQKYPNGTIICEHDAIENGYEDLYKESSSYCTAILTNLAGMGLFPCGDLDLGTGTVKTPAPAPTSDGNSGGSSMAVNRVQTYWSTVVATIGMLVGHVNF